MTAATTARPVQSVIALIQNIAAGLGVDPKLALAIAQTESDLNPDAIGDNGTSFGLYQLHEGGELGNLSSTQAFDPATNATVALSEVASVQKQYPGATPGQIAALAQRPANPSAYTAEVNYYYAQLASGVAPTNLAPYSGTTSSATLTSAVTTSAAPGHCDGSKYLINGPLGIHLISECQAKAIRGAAILTGGAVLMLAGVALLVALARGKAINSVAGAVSTVREAPQRSRVREAERTEVKARTVRARETAAREPLITQREAVRTGVFNEREMNRVQRERLANERVRLENRNAAAYTRMREKDARAYKPTPFESQF